MEQYISKTALVAEIKRRIDEINQFGKKASYEVGLIDAYKIVLSFLDTIEVTEVDLEKEAELIANGIMIDVQANKYNTVVYNTKRNDFNHSHLMLAAKKGIELGLKVVQKGE